MKKLIDLHPNFEIPHDVVAHGKRVGIAAFHMYTALGQDEAMCRNALIAGIHHDDGKALISQEILYKSAALTTQELNVVKGHAFYGFKMAQCAPHLESVALAILFHHERMDGSGYFNLEGDKIPHLARVIAVADVFDALTSDRVYRPAYTVDEALNILNDEKHLYDPDAYRALLACVPDIEFAINTVSDLLYVV